MRVRTWLAENPGRVLAGLVVSTLAVMLVLGALGKQLETPETPCGILDLEMPWTMERQVDVVSGWDEPTRQAARVQTRVDFLFLVLYPLTLSLACRNLSRSLEAPEPSASRWVSAGTIISGLVLLAAPLDAIENVLMLVALGGCFFEPGPLVTSLAAVAKFGLVLLAFGYLVLGGVRWLQLRVTSAGAG